jgi:hypothetical protein
MIGDRYGFHTGVVFDISGDARVRRHFEREYGQAASQDSGAAAVEAYFGHMNPGVGPSVAGGHKTMHWQVALSEPEAEPLTLRVRVSGLPRSYAMSLVQGYYLEPLLSVAATRAGVVLLPAASVVVDGKATLVIGLSGSGKTSLSILALALQRPLLGDDQVFITPDGVCRPFPRCLRLYPDLRERAPLAYRGLMARDRARLAVRRVARTLTAGWVAPSLVISRSSLGDGRLPGPAPAGRIVLLVRSRSEGEVRVDGATTGDAIDFCLEALREQRHHLAEVRDDWRKALARIEKKEARLLGRAFACVPVCRVTVPTPLSATGLAGLAEQLGIIQPGPAEAIGSRP